MTDLKKVLDTWETLMVEEYAKHYDNYCRLAKSLGLDPKSMPIVVTMDNKYINESLLLTEEKGMCNGLNHAIKTLQTALKICNQNDDGAEEDDGDTK